VKPFVKILLLLAIPLALVVCYAFSSIEIGKEDFSLEKADLSKLKNWFPSFSSTVSYEDSIAEVAMHMPTDCWPRIDTLPPYSDEDTITVDIQHDTVRKIQQPDTIRKVAASAPSKPIHVPEPDSTKLRVMIFGDSMLEWLSKRLCDYTMENGYDFTSVLWYSSSTKLWAETDTLEYFLNRIKPDYILLCLGSNELFVRDLAKREKYISTIVQRISDKPFVWISPPNWKPDSGINDLIIQAVGPDRYFDSRNLELERASDHAHPTRAAAAIWADTIASWLSSSAPRTPLPMNPPTEQRTRKYHQIMLKPVQ